MLWTTSYEIRPTVDKRLARGETDLGTAGLKFGYNATKYVDNYS